jgi:hypothetical protein
MFRWPLKELPACGVHRILILRTAPIPQVQWAIERLRAAYPDARFWVLGRQLEHPVFADMQRLEIRQMWLSPRSYKPFRREVEKLNLDLAVMCLNSDSCMGYERVSRVMKKIPAGDKLVAGYSGEWFHWKHALFQQGSGAVRWMVSALEFLLLPLVYALVAGMSSSKTYMPAGQGRKTPGYDR